MPADLLAPLALVLSWCATYVVHSTCLVIGVGAFLRGRPATGPAAREALWKTALIGGLLTTPAQMLLGCSPFLHQYTLQCRSPGAAAPARADVVENSIAVHASLSGDGDIDGDPLVEGVALADLLIVDPSDASSGDPLPGPSQSAAKSAARPRSLNETQPWWSAGGRLSREQLPGLGLVAAFLCASLATTAYGLGRYARQTLSLKRRLVGASVLAAGPARRLLDELCRLVPRAPTVRLVMAPHFSEPAAFGLWRWTIVLPERAERDLSVDELRALLAHELAHLVRGDMWWLLASRVICSCCGFQPLNHLARREWQRSAEYLCDAWAVSRTGSRLSLARCLAEVAGWRWNRPDCAATMAATGRRSGLADRIERLVGDSPLADRWSDLRLGRAMTALCGLLLAGLIGLGPQVRLTAAMRNVQRIGQPERDAPDEAAVGASAPEGLVHEAEAANGPAPVLESAEALLAALNDELALLERELTELQPLLQGSNAPAAAAPLVERLEQERLKLQRRRAHLQKHMVHFGSEIRPSADGETSVEN